MVIGLLGILKAGGAYVPLDPRFPAERLAMMVEDSAASVILTQAKLADTLDRRGATGIYRPSARLRAVGRVPLPDVLAARMPNVLPRRQRGGTRR